MDEIIEFASKGGVVIKILYKQYNFLIGMRAYEAGDYLLHNKIVVNEPPKIEDDKDDNGEDILVWKFRIKEN
jgi:hypothetical protein